jgi:predicted ATPase
MAAIYGQMGQPEKGLALLEQSMEVAERTLHRMWEAELHRGKGELLLLQHASEAEAERCYKQALEVARRQQSKSFELRAAMSLSRLWQQQGKEEEAYALLSDVYGWFTEGFDTRDLKEAQALLERLK